MRFSLVKRWGRSFNPGAQRSGTALLARVRLHGGNNGTLREVAGCRCQSQRRVTRHNQTNKTDPNLGRRGFVATPGQNEAFANEVSW